MSLGVMDPNVKRSLNFADNISEGETEPPPPLKSYLCLTIFTCFCPAYPINILALVFSIMSRNSYYIGAYDGSRRLGRAAFYLGIASIIIGLVVIAIICAVQMTNTDD